MLQNINKTSCEEIKKLFFNSFQCLNNDKNLESRKTSSILAFFFRSGEIQTARRRRSKSLSRSAYLNNNRKVNNNLRYNLTLNNPLGVARSEE